MELERHYVFPGKEEIIIEHPKFIIVSDNGHRVFDGEISHYIPYGWIHLWWKNPKGNKQMGSKRSAAWTLINAMILLAAGIVFLYFYKVWTGA